jgi:hypothetical protein
MKIVFEEPALRRLKEWAHLSNRLRAILTDIMEVWPTQKNVRIGNIYRSRAENKKAKAKSLIHVTFPHRAVDLKGAHMTMAQLDAVCDHVNALWMYDRKRPSKNVAFWRNPKTGKAHGSGRHIHVQSHPRTARR